MESIIDSPSREIAVKVTDAYKSYVYGPPVLKAINMAVQRGTIYGLLGPSGCGKTTLLNCIIGRRNLDSGTISLKITKSSQFGYMPQELGLFTDFSIRETLSYFGCIFGLLGEELEKRSKYLLDLLELPPDKRIVKELSGGQQRRVSFCVALLHDPELLILDEPTVGLDPMLSNSIWQKLLHMSTIENKTIIITTHYIEEARSAHTIGLMRKGMLLAEEEPNRLIQRNNCDSLEHVFLKLSNEQLEISPSRRSVKDGEKHSKDNKANNQNIVNETFSLRRVKAQFLKSRYWMKNNIPIMMFLLGLPFVQTTLFNCTIGIDPIGLRVGVVNEELSTWKNDCLNFSISCGETSVSCLYLNKLKEKNLTLVDFGNIKSAQNAIRRNDVWGMIYFGENYTVSLMDRIKNARYASSESIDFGIVNVWIDMSNQYIGNMVKWDLFSGYLTFLENVYESCGWPPRAGVIPVYFNEAVYGTNNPSFRDFAAPAVLQLFVFYLPMMFTAGAVIMEKRGGMLERSLVSGINLKETMAAHLTVQVVLLILQTVITMVVSFVMFDIPLEGGLLVCVILLFLIGINGTCYGFFIATVCDSETGAAYLGLGSFFPFCLLSGMVWPIEGMHSLLRFLSKVLPLTFTTEAMRAIMLRGWSINHPAVYVGFLSTMAWIFIISFSTYIVVKLKMGIKSA